MTEADTPTILEWAGGTDAFRRWLERFYDLLEEDGTLVGLFGGSVSREHREHVLLWWVEVMGGPAEYTAQLGGYPTMLAHHRGLAITPDQRRLFVTLLSQAADESDLPSDPEFRAAIMGYAEWGSRLALHNSDPEAEDVATEAPTPRWGWGVAPPYEGRARPGGGEARGTGRGHPGHGPGRLWPWPGWPGVRERPGVRGGVARSSSRGPGNVTVACEGGHELHGSGTVGFA